MIKVNLLGADDIVDGSRVLLLGGYLFSFCVVLAGLAFLNFSTDSEIRALQGQNGVLEGELAKLQEETKEVRHLEKLESELNSKLAVIATLKKSKIGPVRVLDDLNLALPDRAWITEVREEQGRFILIGYALDDFTISTFMKELQDSDYFEQVDLEHSKAVDVERVRIREFRVTAKVNYAGRLLAAEGSGSGSKDSVPAKS